MCRVNLFGCTELFHSLSEYLSPLWVLEKSTSVVSCESQFDYISDPVDKVLKILWELVQPSVLFCFVYLYIDS